MAMHTVVAAAAALALCLVATAATAGAGAHPPAPAPVPAHDIASCLVSNGVTNFSLPASKSFKPILDSSLRYLRFDVPSVGKPAAIVLPASQRELQRAVLCARSSSLAIRVRSGGHSYEGLSYTSENHVPFVVIDLANLNQVRVDPASATVWAESGATLGQLYHALRLVPVPGTITVFDIDRRGPADLIAGLIHKWQYVGPHLPDEFYISTRIYFKPKSTNGGNLTMSFTGQVLGPKHLALSVLNKAYPELRLAESELSEVSWVESAAKFAGLFSVADLTSRQIGVGEYAKRKSDYVQAPISEQDMVKVARYMTAAPTEGSVSHAASWGQRYFLHNFDRLVRAKSKIDPLNVFNNAQSIPPSH
ncbi:hypothetical protein C2845_PM14G03230 [Panicum miliaceum]|uniref:FAD-binding PCMH-type domain-containing protein n=1 Tax=Panicum miliaceum TaxID=4540 RepID=A0A3L6PN32_PANMI|nr:hypothetical protein C2845_PM14G03230 [Panicum miliaceum]